MTLKVVQIIQRPQLRGAEIFASQLSNELSALGHTSMLVSLFPGKDKLPLRGKLIELNRDPGRRFVDVAGWKRLAHLINKEKPDIVQANASDTLKFSVMSKALFGWKARIVFRNANKISYFVRGPFRYWFNRFLLSRVRLVISVSEECRLDLVKTFSYDEEKTVTIPIGIDMTSSVIPSAPGRIEGAVTLLNVASLVPEKDHETLIRVHRKILDTNPKARLVVAGNGPQLQALTGLVDQLGTTNKVTFLGTRTDVLNLMSGADVFVLTSKAEGLPAVILEAQYARLPVVASDVGGISEVIEHGKSGWIVPAGDMAGFAETIQRVLSMEDADIDRVKDTAHKFVTGSHDNRVIAARFVSAYLTLINGK